MDNREGRVAPPDEPYVDRKVQAQQAAAAAAGYIERYFDSRPPGDPAELAKAKAAIDRALVLTTTR
jgi:hypothetical protein